MGEINWLNLDRNGLEWNYELTAADFVQLKAPANFDGIYLDIFLDSVLPQFVKELNLTRGR